MESQVRWYPPVTPALGRLILDQECEPRLDYIARPCLKTAIKEDPKEVLGHFPTSHLLRTRLYPGGKEEEGEKVGI